MDLDTTIESEISKKEQNKRCILTHIYAVYRGFPSGSAVKNPPAMQVRKAHCRKAWQHTPVFLSGEFHGFRSMEGYSPYSFKEPDKTEVTECARTCNLEKKNDIEVLVFKAEI